jgi:hypothetical protein
MKKALLIFLFLWAKTINAQPIIFFGIDLNSDWYTLTNISKQDYVIYTWDNPESKTICVAPRKELSIAEFTSMGIDKISLCFSVGERDLNLLKPEFCLGRHNYESESEFKSNAYRDFNILLEKFKKIYGQPSENNSGEAATAVQWVFSNQQIFISIDREDYFIMIGCLPQR